MVAGISLLPGVEQLAARKAHNLEVAGSSPAPSIPPFGSRQVDRASTIAVQAGRPRWAATHRAREGVRASSVVPRHATVSGDGAFCVIGRSARSLLLPWDGGCRCRVVQANWLPAAAFLKPCVAR